MITRSMGRQSLRRVFQMQINANLNNNARIALCQISVGADKIVNINRAEQALLDASRSTTKIDIAVLPEVWNSPYSTASFPVYAELVPEVGKKPDPNESPSTAMLCRVALKCNIWLVGGSIPERQIGDGLERLFNTCIIVNPRGEVVAKHRKVHLFDIDIPGKVTFKESDSLSAGNDITVVDTPWGGLGVGICYDIRFPELALLMRQKGCRLIVYPGAFNMVTGPAHWELLQRARAVDNQLYVAACSPARNTTSGGYVAWGHSSVISPWGEVVAAAGHGDETIFADLDFDRVEEIRQNIPCWFQKRKDLYTVAENAK